LIASLGLSQVPVVRQPRVRIVVTGNEVVTPGTSKSLYQIYDANSYMLRGLIGRDGAVLEAVHRRRDDPEAIREALAAPGQPGQTRMDPGGPRRANRTSR